VSLVRFLRIYLPLLIKDETVDSNIVTSRGPSEPLVLIMIL